MGKVCVKSHLSKRKPMVILVFKKERKEGNIAGNFVLKFQVVRFYQIKAIEIYG